MTATTLTTTGFGDITLQGESGRLIQTIFRPTKVRFICQDCGLFRRVVDAVHCKHFRAVPNIRSDGKVWQSLRAPAGALMQVPESADHFCRQGVTICGAPALAIAVNAHTFISTSTNRKEGGPMSSEYSVLVAGMGVQVKIARQPSH